MAIKNYTTTVNVYQSLAEIQGSLAAHGAAKVMVDYEDGHPVSVTFSITTPAGPRGFILPAAVDGTLRVFQKQKVKTDREQAERTAWRNVRDWVMAQMALIESCDIPLEQPFLPYMANTQGETLYEIYSKGQLLLEG